MMCSSTTTFATPSRVGRSNMVSINECSRIERSPRAPVLRANALAGLKDLDGALREMQQALSLDNFYKCLYIDVERIFIQFLNIEDQRGIFEKLRRKVYFILKLLLDDRKVIA